jgi:hypothetical protein
MTDLFKKPRLASAEEGAGVTPAHDSEAEPVSMKIDCADQAQASDCGPAPTATAAVTPLGALLARHVIRDGEVVLLALKPSRWFILLSSLRFVAVVAIVALGLIASERRYNREWFWVEAAIFLIGGRIMWAVLQWMGRLYVLTDMRVIRLSGVFRLEIFDCALRKVARTQVTASVKERVCATGSIEIIPSDEQCATGVWQTVPRPVEVNEMIVSTINKAKAHGYGAAA